MPRRSRRRIVPRSTLPVLVAVLAVLPAGLACRPGSPAAVVHHSAILITVDTLRADALGFAGDPRVATPALDRLAAAGRVFDFAHAHAVTTLPSHASILTGLYPYQHGARHNAGFVLAGDVPTLASRLRDAGFATAAVVGAFPLAARFGLDRGFEVYDDPGLTRQVASASGLAEGSSGSTGWMADPALTWLTQ